MTRPCAFCGDPTERVYSVDMDLPGVPLCPSFRQLMEDVDAGKVDVVIVHKLDRFSRNLTVTLQSLGRIDRAGAAFVSVVEHIDMATPMGRLMLKLMASFAEFYSDNLASSACPSRRSSPRLNQAETEAGAPI
jgi:DNA invertase Pin-like site-specific DNA recombinase